MTLNDRNATLEEIKFRELKFVHNQKSKSAQSIGLVAVSVNKIRVNRAHRVVIFAIAWLLSSDKVAATAE